MNQEKPFLPTQLFISEHNITKKKYLAKTTKLNDLQEGRYNGSGKRYKRHKQKHGDDVSVIWKSEVFTDKEECEEFALFLSEELNVVENDQWLNLKPENGLDGGVFFGYDTEEFQRKKVANTDYTMVAESNSKTKNDPKWKETIGKEAARKRLETIDLVENGKKISATKQDPLWKETIGKEARRKQVVNTDYKASTRKGADTRLTEEWKEKNTHICDLCGKSVVGKGNLTQHRRKCSEQGK